MSQAALHVSEAKRIRKAALKMASLPAIKAKYLAMAKEQIEFARNCKDKSI